MALENKMMDDISDIASFYDSDPERERCRLERHQLEYDLTWRYLNRYLPSQGFILEVGAANGGYTLQLAKRGYTITAVDLSAVLIEECRKRIAGVEPAISADDESYNKLQGKQRQLWLDLFYEMSTEKSILGASRHILYIGKKGVE
jgi:2-polyprenyl-3-methyl-5-hydroxy-6-metoxy-1,4-benzoquinol methylase